MKSTRILVGLLTVLLWIASTACATSSEVKLPPGFTVKWNIAPKDSVVEQDFVITEYRYYQFDIKFSSTRQGIGPITELERMKKFIGSGSSSIVTKESANTDHPEVVIARTPEEVQRRDEGVRKGIYVYKALHPGVIVPVHIRIEQVDNSGATTVHTDELADTGNFYAAGSGGLFRKIIDVKLRPGKYRLRANTPRDSPLPPDMDTFLRAVQVRNSRVLKDNQ